jgi:hypothetical protein
MTAWPVLPGHRAYVRDLDQGAAWVLAQLPRRLIDASLLAKSQIDGLCAASFTRLRDTAAGFTQQVKLSLRVLAWLPTGGVCGVIALWRHGRCRSEMPKWLHASPAIPRLVESYDDYPVCQRRSAIGIGEKMPRFSRFGPRIGWGVVASSLARRVTGTSEHSRRSRNSPCPA